MVVLALNRMRLRWHRPLPDMSLRTNTRDWDSTLMECYEAVVVEPIYKMMEFLDLDYNL